MTDKPRPALITSFTKQGGACLVDILIEQGDEVFYSVGGYVELLPSDGKPWARTVRAVSRRALLGDEA